MNSKKVKVNGNQFITDSGNPFIPKGINMVCKDKSRNYLGDYKPEDFKFLREKGFNLIRLGLIWDGCEPEPGVYDEEYFKGIDQIIDMASNEEISVFLDMHQDLYGVVFEDGAPKWATVTDGKEHYRTELWSESYLISPAVQHAFDNFWKNTILVDGTGIRTRYINLWKFIAARYGNNPYVIGYDVMNEPFPGTPGMKVAEIMGKYMPDGDMSALEDFGKIAEMIGEIAPITMEFETTVLNPFYDELARAIRSVDKNGIIMFESNYFANAGVPSMVKPAEDEDGNVIEGQAYVPHGYDILVDTEAYETGGCERVAFIFGSLLECAKKMNIPTMIGEWGCYPNASEAQKEQARFLLNLFKNNCVGNVYYDFSHIRDGGILEVLTTE
ncbi:MAG: cellulase family glycosylhydrolase [Lachnospiraceae bacterium]|nr:cellulase family glycosylhydrolase [Lachnospiraceae bacterium]